MHKELKKEVVGTAEGNGTKTFDIEFPIDEVPPSHVDSDAIGIGYNIKIDVGGSSKSQFTSWCHISGGDRSVENSDS